MDFVWLLGADEFDMSKLGNAFVVYQGTHGDAGAHRADVILPGAAYTEKDGIYVNFEGRVQRTKRAVFPPGDAKEDWAIIRAFSEIAGKKLPYDSRDELHDAMYKDALSFKDMHEAPAHLGADPAVWNPIGTAGTIDTKMPLECTIGDFYLTNPIARASETMAECSRILGRGAQQMAAE
jgi:NADH-quinone oxidoreductase subunit G